MLFSPGHHQPIGLDIGHERVRMVQLAVANGTATVRAAAAEIIPEAARHDPGRRMSAALEIVKRLLRQRFFSGRSVVAALPRELLSMKNLRLPMMPAQELEAAVQFEAQGVFGFDMNDARVHCLPAGEVRQGNERRQEVILLAARNHEIDEFVEQLHSTGAVLEGIDAEPCALYRSVARFARRREDEHQVHVLVDIGYERTQIVIGRGGQISFYKSIEIAGRHLHEAVSRKLGITQEEAQALRRRLRLGSGISSDPVRQAVYDATRSLMESLGREIAMCLRYYLVTFRGTRPEQVRLVGGEAGDPQLQAVLRSALTISVEAHAPLSVCENRAAHTYGFEKEGLLTDAGGWAISLGLGLKRVEGPLGPHGTATAKTEFVPQGEVVMDLPRSIEEANEAASEEPASLPEKGEPVHA